MTTVISVENLSKTYRLGQIGTGTFTHDLAVWWAKVRGRPNPMLKIGQADHGNRDGEDLMALRDVSFTVQQGEVLGIIGKNGAGKSTLLKILSRVTAPTSGRIKVKGRIASLLEVGTGFHPELTGRENIYLNGSILGMSRQEVTRKFDEIVDFSGVEQFIDTPVKRYSSGMYVRLAFAVAAHLDPEILVVDEVLAVGDAEFQKKCLGKMGDVAKEGRTVLFVSHNMAAVQNLCPSSLLIDQGQIVTSGDTSSVVGTYLSRGWVASQGVSLRERQDRKGTGAMRFTQVAFCNESGDVVDVGQTGKPLTVVLKYACHDQTFHNAVVLVTFVNSDGHKLFHCLSRDSYPGVAHLIEKGQIACHFPKFPLLPGKYSVDLWCKMNEIISDEITSAFILDVVLGDYYGTGKVNPNLHDGLLVDHSWEFSA